ncbi:BrxE family protein [Tabrizicola sp. BL-A-41-H6]|uniref:BrxE family protein n=1 Tax=Tabrizicola sp. BL-A-41-H6 TaxID=3421107 RepID=UPI003D66A935
MVLNEQFATMRRLIELRYLVGFLGEKSQRAWWPTSFYEASSIRFLEPVFSRSAPLAQYHGAVEAARRFHDENLSVGSFHLFRLPEEIEQDLHEMVRAQPLEHFDPSLIVDRATALNALSNVGHGTANETVGPVLVGKIDELRTSALLDKIGAIYQRALSSDTHALPYMVA